MLFIKSEYKYLFSLVNYLFKIRLNFYHHVGLVSMGSEVRQPEFNDWVGYCKAG